MAEFKTIRQAKEYLVGKIADEALHEGVPLTEVERKMLYFTESGWTLRDMMAVSGEFDREYDQDEYEEKIGRLVRGIEASSDARSQQEIEDWDEAVLKLSEEDHYLLVLIDAGSHAGDGAPSRWDWLKPWLPRVSGPAQRKPGDVARLLLAAVVGSVLMVLFVFLRDYLRGK